MELYRELTRMTEAETKTYVQVDHALLRHVRQLQEQKTISGALKWQAQFALGMCDFADIENFGRRGAGVC